MEDDRIQVRPTRIGRGVFALQSIAPETLIAEISGKVVSELDDDYDSNYCMDLGDGRVLDPHAPCRFLNHSCDPNCELVIWEDEPTDPPQLCLYSLTEIQPGQELSIDYGWLAGPEIPCRCGSNNCRGWIMAADDLHAVQQP